MINVKSRIESFIGHYIRSNHQKIHVAPGECRYNFQCHSNAVHDAIVNNWPTISLCVYFDSGGAIIHFLNVKDGLFVDNTLGTWCRNKEYYHIRFIDQNEFDDVHCIHASYRKYLKSMLPWYLRLFHNEAGF